MPWSMTVDPTCSAFAALPRGYAGVVSTLPGQEVVEAGLADLRRGTPTPAGYAVLEARTRLRQLGHDVPAVDVDRPSHRLYELLAAEDPATAHGRHHALLRRMTSYVRAAEHAARR